MYTKGEKIMAKVISFFNEVRKCYKEITDDKLDSNGAIYYMNSNDGTNFDWNDDQVQTGVAVTDVKTGAIVAISAGRNYAPMGLNRATDLKQQNGIQFLNSWCNPRLSDCNRPDHP